MRAIRARLDRVARAMNSAGAGCPRCGWPDRVVRYRFEHDPPPPKGPCQACGREPRVVDFVVEADAEGRAGPASAA